MTVANFNHLAETLVEIFPTEVVETYFVRSIKGKCAQGKLYNAFVNTRSEIVDSGLLQVNKRNVGKSDKEKSSKPKTQSFVPSRSVSKFPDAINVCQGSNFDNLPHLNEMWESCFDHRQSILREKTALQYFNMFPYLKEADGYQLVRILSRPRNVFDFNFFFNFS